MATDVTLSQPYTLDPRTIVSYRLRVTTLHHHPTRFVVAAVELIDAGGGSLGMKYVQIEGAAVETWIEGRELQIHQSIQTKLGVTPA